MATNMAPHNLVEVIGAARHLIANPTCSLDDLMKFVPGPDLPAAADHRARGDPRRLPHRPRRVPHPGHGRVDSVNPRRKGIVVTELPYLIGPEKVIEKIKDLVQSPSGSGHRRRQGPHRPRPTGCSLVIEVKNGFNPEAVLEQLYRLTPMEESFSINNVALVDGQPRTLGLKDLLKVYVDFRTDVVRRRTAYRLARARSVCTSSRVCSSRSSTSTRSSS